MLELVGRVILVACMSALVPNLKGASLTQPASDPEACRDAAAVGGSCQPCLSKFKLCRGHYVYEPFTVVLFEALVTVVVGVGVTYIVVPNARKASSMLMDWHALARVLPIGATFALGDLMDMAAARNISGTTLLVGTQMRLPLCALLRSVLLGRSQTAAQWILLLVISLLCVAHVTSEIGVMGNSVTLAATVGAGTGASIGKVAGEGLGGFAALGAAWAWMVSSGDGLVSVVPLLLGKCLISCLSAVHAEYFLQHKDVKVVPLWVTQVHFKSATAIGALICGYLQGRRGGRIMANTWRGDLFSQLPPGVQVGDPRLPFFGGWSSTTWLLLSCLVVNNFLVGDQLRRLTSVAKYVAYAFGLVISYSVQLYAGRRDFHPVQACSCVGIALCAVAYVSLPGRTEAVPKQVAVESKKES